ncbi:MAG TPA: hypothetical protein VGM76_15500 [Lacipirellulaceae bacterium]
MLLRVAAFIFSVALTTVAHAGEEAPSQALTDAAAARTWTLALTAYPTDVRGGENYTSVIAAADHGPLHLEARYNYESIGARSAYVGWAFSGGDSLTWQVTPIAGGAWGTTKSFVAGVEASVAWRAVDFYVEAEYVPTSSADESYTYAWSELGLRAAPWLRIGLAGQRTRAYGGDREFQRGPFAQITWRAVTLGGYWFNPGANDQVFVASLGVKF